MNITSFTQHDYDCLVNAIEYEQLNKVNERQDIIDALNTPEEKIYIKDLSFEDKCLFVKALISSEYTQNIMAISNLYAIMFASNLSNESFEQEDSWISSLIEYLDIKKKLKPEIDVVYTRMAEYIIGVLKGYSKVLDDNRIHSTNLYFHFLNLIDFKVMSTVLRNAVVTTPYNDIPVVMGAYEIFENIESKHVAHLLWKEFFVGTNGKG